MSPEELKAFEKRVVRKIDMRIMPLIILSYLINYLDRSNLGNARTLNSDKPGESLVETLKLSGMRYNIVVAIFYITYVLFEFPSTFLMKKFTPSRWIRYVVKLLFWVWFRDLLTHLFCRVFSRIMVTWGIVTICSAAVKSYTGLIIARLALGVAEAGFFPCCLYLFTFWYKADERATRMAWFAASVAVSGAFGGAIATGVSYLSGKAGLFGWQWLVSVALLSMSPDRLDADFRPPPLFVEQFILEGIPAIVVGVIVWFALPDWPETATFLTEDERAFAVARLDDGAPRSTDAHFNRADFFATIKSWQFYAFAVAYFFMANSLNAFGYFGPTIIKNLGYSGPKAQLMTVPPNIVAFFVILANAMHSDRTRERPKHIIAGLIWVGLGYVLLATVKTTGVRFFAVCCIASTNAAVMPFVAWRASTVQGATSTAIATAFTVALSNSAGAVAPFLFIAKDGPNYTKGNWTCFAMLVAAAVIVLGLWYSYGASSQYQTHAEIHDGKDDVADEEAEVGQVRTLATDPKTSVGMDEEQDLEK
ncbi:BQ2448_3609 [Microbotryum intermedium]|uniref:BQ2448_3609 protein n=1 Tax=Microbotryum intermedium TaxID=269621 RepID=A0A238FCE1_9BASI|nr:BQ2448_3609 [Microbotryum intermedium]